MPLDALIINSMSFTSFSQNFEDVRLWRALNHVNGGFYIDVGAQHPVVDSVSKAFYLHGWRGIHVEPTLNYSQLLRQDRPDEVVLQVAVGDKVGEIDFFEIENTGLSTGDVGIANAHREKGYTVVETSVTCMSLAHVFFLADRSEIHWLKIDVEGMECDVLNSWGSSKTRPWIVVVESTYPNTQIDTYQQWEHLIYERGYKFAYFDGLSRYYVHQDQKDILNSFVLPVNIFDGFSLDVTVPFNGPSREMLHQRDVAHFSEIKLIYDRFDAILDTLAQKLLACASDADVAQKEINSIRDDITRLRGNKD